MRNLVVLIVLGVLIAGVVPSAQGVIVPFDIFTDNGDYSDGSLVDIFMDVFNGEGVAKFKFYNSSSTQCSITNIYFDDGSLLGIDSIENGSGTSFDRPTGGPGNLPGGNLLDPDFIADREFNVGADSPPYHNGVNHIGPGEWVTITFNLTNGGTLGGVLSELVDGRLRVGLHVQGFDEGSSESLLNQPVPEPGTICLFGLGALALLRNRKTRI